MSHFSIVRDASRALRALLFNALTTDPDVNFGFTNVTNDIILSAPDSDIPSGARLSIYLFSIEPDAQLRNQRALSVGTAGTIRAPLALRTHYLITPLLDDEELNQLMLGRVMQALHDKPAIENATSLDDSQGGGSAALRLAMEPLRLDDIARVWHAMGNDYRLSVAYQMQSVLIDSALPPEAADRVIETHVVVQQRADNV